MKKIWKVVTVIGLVALAFGATSLAYAQTESPQPYSNPDYGQGMMGGRGRFGGDAAYGEVGLYHEINVESFAGALGLTASQLETRLESGETMWQVAEAEGISREEFSVIMQDARSTALDQAVEDGYAFMYENLSTLKIYCVSFKHKCFTICITKCSKSIYLIFFKT